MAARFWGLSAPKSGCWTCPCCQVARDTEPGNTTATPQRMAWAARFHISSCHYRSCLVSGCKSVCLFLIRARQSFLGGIELLMLSFTIWWLLPVAACEGAQSLKAIRRSNTAAGSWLAAIYSAAKALFCGSGLGRGARHRGQQVERNKQGRSCMGQSSGWQSRHWASH